MFGLMMGFLIIISATIERFEKGSSMHILVEDKLLLTNIHSQEVPMFGLMMGFLIIISTTIERFEKGSSMHILVEDKLL